LRGKLVICPRCELDTVLWVQKIGRDRIDPKTRKVAKEGRQVFLCEPCKKEWTSISSLFRIYWKKVKIKLLGDAEYEMLYEAFLKENRRHGKSEKRKFAQAMVAVLGYRHGDLTKRQAVFIPEADLLTREDYAWAAGVIDALGTWKDDENPSKICLSIRHGNLGIMERMKDLVGGNVKEAREGRKLSWSFTTTRRNSEVLFKRLEPYLRCSRKIHPEERSNDDRTLAWIAGFVQASSKDGLITASCKWAVRLMGTLFSGVETASGEKWSFAPEDSMGEKLKIFFHRKLDPDGARDSQSGLFQEKAAAFQQARGEDRALRIPKGSQPERPPGPKPNSIPGSTPGAEGSRIVPGILSSVWADPADGDLTPEVEVSNDTLRKLEQKGSSCLVCKIMVKDLKSDGMRLLGGKQVTLKGKISHLYSELGIELFLECSFCNETVALHLWKDDFSLCNFCIGREVAGTVPAADDKKWASV